MGYVRSHFHGHDFFIICLAVVGWAEQSRIQEFKTRSVAKNVTQVSHMPLQSPPRQPRQQELQIHKSERNYEQICYCN